MCSLSRGQRSWSSAKHAAAATPVTRRAVVRWFGVTGVAQRIWQDIPLDDETWGIGVHMTDIAVKHFDFLARIEAKPQPAFQQALGAALILASCVSQSSKDPQNFKKAPLLGMVFSSPASAVEVYREDHRASTSASGLEVDTANQL